jgi:hypothetical protein
MNIEGAEFDALQGLTALPKRIIISCHDFLQKPEARTFASVKSWLEANGYLITEFEPDPSRPWLEFYVYGELND